MAAPGRPLRNARSFDLHVLRERFELAKGAVLWIKAIWDSKVASRSNSASARRSGNKAKVDQDARSGCGRLSILVMPKTESLNERSTARRIGPSAATKRASLTRS